MTGGNSNNLKLTDADDISKIRKADIPGLNLITQIQNE